MIALLAAQLRTLVALVGLVLLAAGFALAYLPLALIVPGGVIVALAVVGARRAG